MCWWWDGIEIRVREMDERKMRTFKWNVSKFWRTMVMAMAMVWWSWWWPQKSSEKKIVISIFRFAAIGMKLIFSVWLASTESLFWAWWWWSWLMHTIEIMRKMSIFQNKKFGFFSFWVRRVSNTRNTLWHTENDYLKPWNVENIRTMCLIY